MKLSEHMRLGAIVRPQAYGVFFSEDGSSCAMGAVMESSGYAHCFEDIKSRSWSPITDIMDLFPVLRTMPPTVPDCIIGLNRNVYGCIVTLNNREHWSREQIADWVATIEPPEPALSLEISPLEIMELQEVVK